MSLYVKQMKPVMIIYLLYSFTPAAIIPGFDRPLISPHLALLLLILLSSIMLCVPRIAYTCEYS